MLGVRRCAVVPTWSCPGKWESPPHSSAFKEYIACFSNYGCILASLLIVLVPLCGREIIDIPVLVLCSDVLGSGLSWML